MEPQFLVEGSSRGIRFPYLKKHGPGVGLLSSSDEFLHEAGADTSSSTFGSYDDVFQFPLRGKMPGNEKAEQICLTFPFGNKSEQSDWSIRTKQAFVLLFAPMRGRLGLALQAHHLRDVIPRGGPNRDGLSGIQCRAL